MTWNPFCDFHSVPFGGKDDDDSDLEEGGEANPSLGCHYRDIEQIEKVDIEAK